MKKLSLIMFLTLISTTIFADIENDIKNYPDLQKNTDLVQCIRIAVAERAAKYPNDPAKQYSKLSDITDLDCSCNVFYDPGQFETTREWTCTKNAFSRTPFCYFKTITIPVRENCEKNKKYEDKDFNITTLTGINQLTNLQTLNLSDNDLSGVEKNDDSLVDFEYLDTLTVVNANLKFIPRISKFLKVLDVSGNKIGSDYMDTLALNNLINENDNSFKNLRHLKINDNPIDESHGIDNHYVAFIFRMEERVGTDTRLSSDDPNYIKTKGGRKDYSNFEMLPEKDRWIDGNGTNLLSVDYDQNPDRIKDGKNNLSSWDKLILDKISTFTDDEWQEIANSGEKTSFEVMQDIVRNDGLIWSEHLLDNIIRDFEDVTLPYVTEWLYMFDRDFVDYVKPYISENSHIARINAYKTAIWGTHNNTELNNLYYSTERQSRIIEPFNAFVNLMKYNYKYHRIIFSSQL